MSSITQDQQSDPSCQEIIALLVHKTLPESDSRSRYLIRMAERFAIVDNILFYLDPKKSHTRRLVVPHALQERLMEQFHSGPFAGHFSGPRTYSAMYPRFWWEGMYSDVVSYC